jgi:putative transcriptional regulator
MVLHYHSGLQPYEHLLYTFSQSKTIVIMIIVNLDVMMARRKMSSGELAEKIGITQANLSVLKTGKAKAVRFSTLEAICKVLDCQPGDILEFRD